MTPLDDYYCGAITVQTGSRRDYELANREKLEAIQWCEACILRMGIRKLLHWLRHNPDKRAKFASASSTATWSRPRCAGLRPVESETQRLRHGHKWMWNAGLDGLPQKFSRQVDPLLAGVRAKLDESTRPPTIPNALAAVAENLACARHSDSSGAFDAHWDAIGAGAREGDVVNVVGTSTCIIAYAKQRN